MMQENKIYTKKCFVCRKKFEVQDAEEWAYKRKKRYFCSYGCLRRYEKAKEKDVFTLGKFADDLFDIGWAKDEIKFKIIGSDVKQFGRISNIQKEGDGVITITVEVDK